MRATLRTISLVAAAAILVSSSAAHAANNWIGTWKLNVAASKFSPGPAPKSQTLTFEAVEDAIKLTSNTVDTDGKVTVGEYVSKFDGQDVPWKGNPNADTASVTRVDDNSYKNAWKRDGKVVIKSVVVVSPDGKMLTITQKGKGAQDRFIKNTAVFDRQ
jgi:hypothetical protein